MSKKHKANKGTLDVGTAEEWNDDHIDDFTTSIDINPGLRTTAIASAWTLSAAAGGNNPAISVVDAAGSGHSCMVLNTGAGAGKSSEAVMMLAGQALNVTSETDLPILTMAVQVVTVEAAGIVAEWGLAERTDAQFTKNLDHAYFRIEDGVLYAVTGNSAAGPAAETTTDLGAYSEFGVYRIEYASVGATIHARFYVDDMDTPAADHTTNLPSKDLTVKAGVITPAGADSTIRMDACGLQILRKTA